MNKFCQNCQQSNPPEASFCRNCASPLPGAQPGGDRQAAQQTNQPNFGGQQAPQNFAQPAMSSGAASQRAMTACGLAFAGLVCCGPLTSIPAMIVGWMEIAAIKQGQSPPNGMKFAQIGLWGGGIVTLIQGAGFLFWLIFSMAAMADSY
jgi:hypothetical protein